MLDTTSPTSSKSNRPFWPRLTRALALVVVAGAAHVWVDDAVRIVPPSGTSSLARAGAAPTFVPPGDVRAHAPRQEGPRVPILTERIPVPALGIELLAPGAHQRAAREDGAVGTTGRLPEVAATEPQLRPVEEPAVPPPAVQQVSQEPPPAHDPRDAEEEHSGIPLTQVSRLTPLPSPRARITAPVEADQQQLVRDLLQRYVTAFEQLDVDAAKAVWPTVDGKALQRAFNQLQAQRVTFESCGITIAGSGANARCRGQATYQPRIGSRTLHVPSREWNFQLARAGNEWQIVDARVR